MEEEYHNITDKSKSGAPAAGEAIRDMFSTDEIFHRVIATSEDFRNTSRLQFFQRTDYSASPRKPMAEKN